MIKLVKGIGFNDGKYSSNRNGRRLVEYGMWMRLLERCGTNYSKDYPTYIGVTCSDNFKSYSYFYEWCQSQVGFDNRDSQGRSWHLDKDILIKGSKLYSEDTCVFVPARVNTLFIKKDANRGEYPVGVSFTGKSQRFRARCNIGNGKHKHIGYFSTPEEAFLAYKTFKEALIKEVADEYKEQLDSRTYYALINYKVEIND